MKKRMLCIVMVFVLIGLSVMIWPVSAEPMDTGTMDVVEETVTASTNLFTLSQTKKIMGVGTTATLSTVPATTAIWSSSNPSVVSVNGITGEVQALKRGTATITASYTFAGGETFSQSCQIQVLDEYILKNETYYLAFSEQPAKCITAGRQMVTKTSTNANSLKWQIQNHGDYYTFKSVTSDLYLGIYMCYGTISDQAKWKIYRGRSGLIIAPYNDINYGGMVLSPASNNPADNSYVGLYDYFDSSVKREWDAQCINTYLDNYYDVSFLNDTELRETIFPANTLVSRVFKKTFNRNVYRNMELGLGTYYSDLTINTCDCGEDVACSNSLDHSLHHKSYATYVREVSDIVSRYENGIVVMWADRPRHAYCYQSNQGHMTGTSPAEGGGTHIFFFAIREDSDGYLLSASSIIFLHEVTHCFGLPDVYGDDHDVDGSMQCVMEYFDGYEAYMFYTELSNNNYALASQAYCPSCLSQLNELVEPS